MTQSSVQRRTRRDRTVARVLWGVGLLLLTLLLSAGIAAAADWTPLQPQRGNGRMCINTGQRDVTYFTLGSHAPIECRLEGPGELKLITRHLPFEGKIGKRSYTLVVMCDGHRVLRERTTKRPSTSAALCSQPDQVVGAAATCVIAIPEGQHQFKVMIEEQNRAVALRLFKQKNGDSVRHTSMDPDEFTDMRTLVHKNGKEYTYFGFDSTRPLVLSVFGPTELIIRTRLDLTMDTDGKVSYGIEVLRNGEPHVTRAYTTEPLTGESYREHPHILPGKSRRLELEVPAGQWTYVIRPADPHTTSLASRILIPKEALGSPGGGN